MVVRKPISLRLWGILILVLSTGLLTTCSGSSDAETLATVTISEELRTWLLSEAPHNALPAGQPVSVRSRSEDAQHEISHVELYLVEFRPEGSNEIIRDLLIRSDAAPFQQMSFTALQPFTPRLPGHYIIKVKGYNKIGESSESETLSFVVR